MKQHFILGLLLVLFLVSKSNAQRQTTYLSSREASKLMSKEMKSSLTINEYYNLAYYKLRQNNPQIAEILFKKAQKISFERSREFKFYPSKSLQRKKEVLQREKDSLLTFDYVSNNDIDIKKEIDLYKSLVEKTYSSLSELIDEAQSKNRVLIRYHGSWSRKHKVLKPFLMENKKLLNPKTEFETKQQFQDRINKYLSLEKEATKKIDERLARTPVPYKQALKDCTSVYNKKQKLEERIDFIKKYAPKMKGYSDSRIQQMNYDAEKQQFTVSVEYDDLNKRRKGIKSYTILVPQSEAQKFKEEKYLHQYLFQLQDLRLVLTSRKVYKIEPIYTWYTKLLCDKRLEESILLIDGKQSQKSIVEYLKYEITNHPKFIKRAKELMKLYKDKLNMTSSKSNIDVYFDTEGKYSSIEIYHNTRVPLRRSQASHTEESNFETEIIKILEQKDIRIVPRKLKCKPVRDSFRFEYTFKN